MSNTKQHTSTSGVRKSRRWKSTTSTERNIRKFQKESDFVHIVKGAPFDRLCREVLQEFGCDLRMSEEFRFGLREVVEDWLQQAMVDARRVCQNSGRRVVQAKHIQEGAYNNLKGSPLLQQCFTRYLLCRQQMGLDPSIKISTAEGEADWMQRRQIILQHNREVAEAAAAASGSGGKSKKRKASAKPTESRSSAKKSKVAKAAASVAKTADPDPETDEDDDDDTTGADSGLSNDTEMASDPPAVSAAE